MKDLEQLESALRKAHAAGDTNAAQAIANVIQQQGQENNNTSEMSFNEDRTASALDRAGAATLTNPQDQFAFWENKYGQGNVRSADDGSFIINDGNEEFKTEKDGFFTGYNPANWDWADISDGGRIAAEVAGGIGGGIVGGGTTFGAGTLVGGALGATAAGEGYDQLMRYITDAETSETISEEALGAAGNLALNVAAPVALSKVGKMASPYIANQVDNVKSFIGGETLQGMQAEARKLSNQLVDAKNPAQINAITNQLDNIQSRVDQAAAAQRLGIDMPTDGLVNKAQSEAIGKSREMNAFGSGNYFSQQSDLAENQFQQIVNKELDTGMTKNQLGVKTQDYLESKIGNWTKAKNNAYDSVNKELGNTELNVLRPTGNKFNQSIRDISQNSNDFGSVLSMVDDNVRGRIAAIADGEVAELSIKEMDKITKKLGEKASNQANPNTATGSVSARELTKLAEATGKQYDSMINSTGNAQAKNNLQTARKIYKAGKQDFDKYTKGLLNEKSGIQTMDNVEGLLNTNISKGNAGNLENLTASTYKSNKSNLPLQTDISRQILGRNSSDTARLADANPEKMVSYLNNLEPESMQYLSRGIDRGAKRGGFTEDLAEAGAALADARNANYSTGLKDFTAMEGTNTYVSGSGISPIVKASEWANALGGAATSARYQVGGEGLRNKLKSEVLGLGENVTQDAIQRAVALRSDPVALRNLAKTLTENNGFNITAMELAQIIDEETQ